mgnify:CR=1 FL=1
MSVNSALEKWIQSADAWITDQGTEGDWARRAVIDPALEKILTNTKGKAVLDLGCGEGRYSRILQGKGALVMGIDPVPQFIKRARSLDSVSTYVEGTAENLPFDRSSFDIVLSYLTFIDIADLQAASQEITRVLRPGGELVVVSISNIASTTEGWIKDDAGNKAYRKVDRYKEHFEMDLEWRGIRIKNYHRPLSYVFGLFLNHGFVLTRFIEPLPDLSDPYYDEEWRVPNFQIYSFKRITE